MLTASIQTCFFMEMFSILLFILNILHMSFPKTSTTLLLSTHFDLFYTIIDHLVLQSFQSHKLTANTQYLYLEKNCSND